MIPDTTDLKRGTIRTAIMELVALVLMFTAIFAVYVFIGALS